MSTSTVPLTADMTVAEFAFAAYEAGVCPSDLVSEYQRQRDREYLDAHPEIEANKPAWADAIAIYWTVRGTVDGYEYQREVGPLLLEHHMNLDGGTVDLGLHLYVPDNDDLPVEKWAALRDALTEAIALVEGADK